MFLNKKLFKLKNPVFSLFKRISVNIHILGIETSCDDTGAAIVNEEGQILGDSISSQHLIHLNNGGIIPPIAKHFHQQNIKNIVNEAILKSNLQLKDIDAIAVTNQPGLSLSLNVGVSYAKQLCLKENKPLIPIHHMQAHALTIRMINKVKYPFLVLLISGGHCLLSIAQNPFKFLLLGKSIDDAPGEAFDKAARRLKLKNLAEFSNLNGGQAIELMASRGDPFAFDFSTSLNNYRDCNFSFSGLKTQIRTHIIHLENKFEVEPDEVIPQVEDLCASFQWVITKHIAMRVARAIEFVSRTNLIPPENRTLVVSGGVACNRFIIHFIKELCRNLDYDVIAPSPKLCTDNGIMIAWNGIEKWTYNKNDAATFDLDSVDFYPKSPIGEDISEQVAKMSIPLQSLKLNKLLKTNKICN